MKILRALAIVAALFGGVVHAQVNMAPLGPLAGGSSGGGGTGQGFTCTAGACLSPNGTFTFNGVDGSPQAQIGSTASSVDILALMGGISGAGGSLVAMSSTDANVPINLTAKGNANVCYGNSGSGSLACAVDPGAAVSTGGQVQQTPSTSNGPVKVGNATYGINLDGGTNKIYQLNGQPLASEFPGYIAANWYVPYVMGATEQTGNAPGSGTITLMPAFVMQRMTLNALGLRVTTLSAAGNVQAAIYASNPATGRPTGTALISSGSMSTAATGVVNATVTNTQLGPGLYWFAINCDNGTAVFSTLSVSWLGFSQLIGSATQGNSLGSAGGVQKLTVTQTFGTWPDLTSASFTEVAGGNFAPIVQFKVASVP